MLLFATIFFVWNFFEINGFKQNWFSWFIYFIKSLEILVTLICLSKKKVLWQNCTNLIWL